jgi:hypothetical protein
MVRMVKPSHLGPFIRMEIIEPMEPSVTDVPARQHQGDRRVREPGRVAGTLSKNFIRIFGPRGNPQASNLFGIIGYLQKQAGIDGDARGCRGI